MNRDEWTFPYSASVLHKASAAKHAFHSDKRDWWHGKQVEKIELIKAEGIEVDESVIFEKHELSTYNSTSGRLPNVSIRNDLLRDVQECVGKVREHTAKMKEYDAWMQVLASQGESMFNLHQDDWLFFFGK